MADSVAVWQCEVVVGGLQLGKIRVSLSFTPDSKARERERE